MSHSPTKKKNYFSFFLLAFCWLYGSNLRAQLVYERSSAELIYGDVPFEIYICDGVLHNYTADTIELHYQRINLELSTTLLQSSLCTEQVCYPVLRDSIVERIPPGLSYKAQLRWSAFDANDDLSLEQGQVEWKLTMTSNNQIIDTLRSTFVYEPDLATSTTEPFSELKVYPNPCRHELYFDQSFTNATVSIFTITGKKLKTLSLKQGRLDIHSLPAGHYLGSFQKEDCMLHFRFIKY